MNATCRFCTLVLSSFLLTLLTSCVSVDLVDPDKISLKGRVLVEWHQEDQFIYRTSSNPVSFKPSFMDEPIVPQTMFTDGGSVPRVLWSVPGLSPWALGPAYIVHDWIFLVHRCKLDAPAHVKAITFEDSAQILAEVGQALVRAGLVKNDRLPLIMAAVRSRYARGLWNTPGDEEYCKPPPDLPAFRRRAARRIVDFTIPPPQ